MNTFIQDLRYGVRVLRKKPGFTVVIIVVLALGIGANAALFSVVNTVLLRPLPYPNPEQLMMVWEVIPGVAQNPVAPPNFVDWREQNQTFADLAAYVAQPLTLTGGGGPEQVEGVYSSDNLFEILGVPPLHGQTFRAGESDVGGATSAVLSYGLWQRRFGGDPNMIGQAITVDGHHIPIGAVMPPAFQFPSRNVDLWIGTTMAPQGKDRVSAHFLRVIGRALPGVTRDQAQADLDGIAARLQEQYPQTNKQVGVFVNPLREQRVGDIRPALLILFAASGFVLLIACVNVANLMLARAASRQKEIAIRLALGAGRLRIARQLLIESLLLASIGGGAGLLVALWGVSALGSLMPESLVSYAAVTVDGRVLLFTLVLSILTSFLFGLLPAWQATRPNLNETLKEGSKGSTGGGPGRVKNLLVVAEVALSLALLIGAGLLINSFMRLSRVDPGFRSENLLMLEVFPPYSKYPDTTRRAAFYDEILQRIEALPGVESASVVTNVPTTGSLSDMLYFAETQAELKPFKAVLRVCGADYFRTMGMPIVSGRAFQEQDRLGQAGVVIINERVAQLYWPGEDAVGKRLKMGQVSTPWLTVVGVVKDTRLQFQEAPPPQVYSPYRQLPSFGPRHLVVRAQSAPLQLVDAVRGAIWAVDSDQAIGSIQTMASLVAEHVAPQRFNMLLLTNFALLALVLAAVGLYGVLSYTVTQNTREIGIRQALGARPVDVLKLVIGQGLLLAMVGVGIGLIGAYWLTRLMVKLLYEVSATDPLTFVGAFVVMIIVTLLACYLPARRATKVDPIVALRYE